MATPADLILKVVEAARDMAADHGGLGAIFSGPAHRLQVALDTLDAALDREADAAGQVNAGHWHPATWRDVKEGDRIRIGGQHEATVSMARHQDWKGSGASEIKVMLEGRPSPYTMPPSGPVEVWKPSLPEWASQAYLALSEGGLIRG